MIIRRCRNEHVWIYDTASCPACGEKWVSMKCRNTKPGQKLGEPNYQLSVFKPYVEDRFDGSDIVIKTRQERDTLCKKHGVTYDISTNLKPKPPNTLGDVGYDQWAEKMNECGIFDKIKKGKK